MALSYLSGKVSVRRRNDPHIRLDRGAPADRGVFAVLQYTEKTGLGVKRHVADLVEKQRPSLCLLEPADPAACCAGKRAPLVTE